MNFIERISVKNQHGNRFMVCIQLIETKAYPRWHVVIEMTVEISLTQQQSQLVVSKTVEIELNRIESLK